MLVVSAEFALAHRSASDSIPAWLHGLSAQLTAEGALQLGNCVTEISKRIGVRVLSPHRLRIKLNFGLAALVCTAQGSPCT